MKPIVRTKEEKAELKDLQKEFAKQQAKANFYECNKEPNP